MATNVSNITEDIGGFPYILNYLGIYLPYSLISFIAVIVGITGNVLIIVAVLVSKELRKNSTCILITNLAISDLSISLFVNTATVTGVLVGKAFFDRNVAFCVFFGAACLISCATSLLTMGLLAFNRYICIFYNHKYNKYFSVRNTLISSVFSWIVAAILDAPNYIPEIGGHVYDTKTLSCLFDRLKVGYTYAFSILCILLPCTLIGYLYLRIFCHAYHTKTKVLDNSSTNVNGRSNHRHTMEAVKISKSLFASFFIFAACWVPMSIIYLVDMDNHLPMSAHAFTNLPAHLNSAINPIFYGIYNPKIRNGYKNIIRLISCNRFFPDCSIDDSRTNKSSKQPLGLSLYTLNTENNKNCKK